MPFITMLAPISFLIAAAISNHKHVRTKPISVFLALQSSWMVGFWLYQVIFMIKDGHRSSPTMIAVALLFNLTLNCIFYEFLKARYLNGKDKGYTEYQNQYPRTSRWILNMSMLTTF